MKTILSTQYMKQMKNKKWQNSRTIILFNLLSLIPRIWLENEGCIRLGKICHPKLHNCNKQKNTMLEGKEVSRNFMHPVLLRKH
jgi:hypothetical protein